MMKKYVIIAEKVVYDKNMRITRKRRLAWKRSCFRFQILGGIKFE